MFEIEPTGQPKIPENFLKKSTVEEPENINIFGKNIDASLKDIKNNTSIFDN